MCYSSGRAADYLVPGKMELEVMSRYTSPVNLAVFSHLTVVLLAIACSSPPGSSFMKLPPPSTLGISIKAPHLLGGLAFHGLWRLLLAILGWHLHIKGYNQVASPNPCFCELLLFFLLFLEVFHLQLTIKADMKLRKKKHPVLKIIF